MEYATGEAARQALRSCLRALDQGHEVQVFDVRATVEGPVVDNNRTAFPGDRILMIVLHDTQNRFQPIRPVAPVAITGGTDYDEP